MYSLNRFTDSEYPFGIFKLFLCYGQLYQKIWANQSRSLRHTVFLFWQTTPAEKPLHLSVLFFRLVVVKFHLKYVTVTVSHHDHFPDKMIGLIRDKVFKILHSLRFLSSVNLIIEFSLNKSPLLHLFLKELLLMRE